MKGVAFLFFAGVMESLSHSECRRVQSWWWNSRNTAKNSKWLHQNTADIDGKVKTMIKLIDEDADSFARMAEMYYRKRFELVKLVAEFYRAYRPLTERYRRAMRELNHARRTVAAAFPHQVPSALVQDSPSPTKDGEPDGLIGNAHELSASIVHAVNRGGPVKGDLSGAMRKTGLKQLLEMFGGDETGPYSAPEEKFEDERALVHHVLESIEDMKSSISKHEDEKQQLLVENSVLVASLEQLESNRVEIDSQKIQLEGELKIMAEKYAKVKSDKEKLVEINGQLELQVESLYVKQEGFQCAYNALQEAFSKANRENAYLLKKLSDLTEDKQRVDEHIDVLKRLAFDAKKLASLTATLENLRRKVGTNKKSKKGKDGDFDRVKEDLKEAKDTIVSLSDLNGQLVMNINECPNVEMSSPRMKGTVRMWRSKVMEEAQKGTERIERLQLSIEGIELMVSKMEDDGSRSGLTKGFFQKCIGRKKGHHGGSSKQSTSGEWR